MVIKIFFIFLSWLVLSSFCEVKKSAKISVFSGALTLIMKDLGLLVSPNIRHLPAFPLTDIEKNKYTHKVIAGGIFLSPQILKEMKNHIVFFDESRELKRLFLKGGAGKLVEFQTRGKDPFEVVREGLLKIQPFIKNCEKEILNLKKRLRDWESKVEAFYWRKKKVLFFLGKLQKKKYPEMLMVNDGFVGYLIKKGKIATYPSELAYVLWSEKILKNYLKKDDVLEIGLYGEKVLKISSLKWNMGTRKMFIPGLGQLEFLRKLTLFFKR